MISGPQGGEIVSVLSGGKRSGLSGYHLGDPRRETHVIDVEIAPSESRHYIMLEAGAQTIWRFDGDVDSVSRVIVLGATNMGLTALGS